MKTKEMFAGSFITAEKDLLVNNSPVQLNLQIADCTTELIGEETKYVLSFSNYDKSLVLNKTNFMTLTQIHPSEDTDGWRGKWVALVAQETEYQGRRVWGTRISLTVPKPVAQPQESDDSIPF